MNIYEKIVESYSKLHLYPCLVILAEDLDGLKISEVVGEYRFTEMEDIVLKVVENEVPNSFDVELYFNEDDKETHSLTLNFKSKPDGIIDSDYFIDQNANYLVNKIIELEDLKLAYTSNYKKIIKRHLRLKSKREKLNKKIDKFNASLDC